MPLLPNQIIDWKYQNQSKNFFRVYSTTPAQGKLAAQSGMIRHGVNTLLSVVAPLFRGMGRRCPIRPVRSTGRFQACCSICGRSIATGSARPVSSPSTHGWGKRTLASTLPIKQSARPRWGGRFFYWRSLVLSHQRETKIPARVALIRLARVAANTALKPILATS